MLEKIKFMMSNIFTFLWPFIKQFINEEGKILLSIAMEIVTQLASSNLSGAEKRSAAFDKIKNELISRNISMSTSIINSAIEAAVQKMKEGNNG